LNFIETPNVKCADSIHVTHRGHLPSRTTLIASNIESAQTKRPQFEAFVSLLAAQRDHHLAERQKQANYSQRHHENLRGEFVSPNRFTVPMLAFWES
jgi:hypothetical protein